MVSDRRRALRKGLHLPQRSGLPLGLASADILDPKVMQHEHYCRIAEADRDVLELAVKVKKESTYDFATCGVCSRNWYAWDAPPQPIESGTR